MAAKPAHPRWTADYCRQESAMLTRTAEYFESKARDDQRHTEAERCHFARLGRMCREDAKKWAERAAR